MKAMIGTALLGSLLGLWAGSGSGIVGGIFVGMAGVGVFGLIGFLVGFLLPENFKALMRYIRNRRV
jgi:hypothetical protein